MYASRQRATRSASSRGPAMYLGYCQRSGQYRMMDLPDYMSNVQEGISRIMSDTASAYQGMLRSYGGMGATGTMPRGRARDCGCADRHCECCVCDADVLVHARCGEIRRIPLTFDNETRRDRPVTLQLEKFVTSGGRDLGWNAQLSETQFTLHPCDEHTVTLIVQIRCDDRTGEPSPNTERVEANVAAVPEHPAQLGGCEVGYATIRAEGCLTRPIVVAVAVLPDDCDAYHHPCGCDCCD